MKILCAHTRLAPVADLVPHPRNPNRHPEDQIKLLAKVIERQGWRAPIVVSARSGCIVAGHARREAALRLGLTEVPVDEQEFATEEDELAHLMADNQIAELADMDDAALAALVEDLRGKIDLELAGIIEELKAAELKEVPPQAPPTMSWVLIGIPTVKFGEIAAAVETIAARPDSLVETTVTTK